MNRLALAFVALTAVASVGKAETGKPPEREAALIVYGDDPCPKSSGDEIVVCARRPESERYRLPKQFRPVKPGVAQGAWSNKVAAVEDDQRRAAGLPDTCSPIGSGGQTGCQRAFLQAFRNQRRAAQAEAATIP